MPDIPQFCELANFNKYQPIISVVADTDAPSTPLPEESAVRKRVFLMMTSIDILNKLQSRSRKKEVL